MAITVSHFTYTSAISVALPNTTTGNTLVVIGMPYSGSSPVTIIGITVSTGAATFTSALIRQPFNTYPDLEAWVAPNITGGITPTLAVATDVGTFLQDYFIFELAGMPTTVTQDGTAAASDQPSATACNSPAITTTGTNTIVFAAFSPSQSMTAGQSGWTVNIGAGGSTVEGIAQYKIFTTGQAGLVSTATQAPTGNFGTIIFALKGTGGATQAGTSSVGSLAAMVGTAMVNRRATNPLTPRATIGATAKHTANASVTI